MTALVLVPLLIPLATAVVCLLSWNVPAFQRRVAVAGSALLCMSGVLLLVAVLDEGMLVVQVGSWPAPFGITLAVDIFSALLVAVTGVVGIAVTVFSLGTIDNARVKHGFLPLVNILLFGVVGAFVTGDLFNLYVWFEVLLISSFVLMTLGGERGQLEGGIKYVTLNLLSSALFLAAAGILYGMTGTLNMADAAMKMRALSGTGYPGIVAMLLFVAFGIKAALFPLFFWLPASYHTPPVAVTTLFSGLLTKVGVYAIVRVFTLVFGMENDATRILMLAAAGCTMVVGVLGAVAQSEFRRLLSFHIVSQIGYLLMGLGLASTLGLAGMVFFMVHVILAKSALFMVSGIVYRQTGSYDLKSLGGYMRSSPVLALLFLLPALSLAGLPPLSGFWAKLALVRAGVEQGAYLIVAVALGVSILTLFSMTKIWAEVFWKTPPEEGRADPARSLQGSRMLTLPMAVLAAGSVVFGFGGPWFLELCLRAAEQLADPMQYIHAVLGVSP